MSHIEFKIGEGGYLIRLFDNQDNSLGKGKLSYDDIVVVYDESHPNSYARMQYPDSTTLGELLIDGNYADSNIAEAFKEVEQDLKNVINEEKKQQTGSGLFESGDAQAWLQNNGSNIKLYRD